MILALLLGFACEKATPLPPPAREVTRVTAQMVVAGDVRGYLVRASGSTQGVLMLTSGIDEKVQAQAKTFSGATVLAIAPTTDATKSRAYLEGLEGIQGVRLFCARERCPEVTAEVEQSNPQAHQVAAQPGQPSDR